MPRYMVERTFPSGTPIPIADTDSEVCLDVIERNADQGVTWVHSYVTGDRRKTFCVCDAPSPEAIRRTARSTSMPVDRITEVRVLDPYSYRQTCSPAPDAGKHKVQTSIAQPITAVDQEGPEWNITGHSESARTSPRSRRLQPSESD